MRHSLSRRTLLPLVHFVALAIVFGFASQAAAQKESVRPGINKSFADPNVPEFVERFEREGRDAYDHREQILEACHIKPGMVVADIGAGTGLFTRLFAPQVGEKGRVYAVDISKKFLKHVTEKSKKLGQNNVVGVLATPRSVELPAASIDLAFICDVYHHFEYPQDTLASIHKALRPGGQLVLIDFHRIEGKSSDWILKHVRAGQAVVTQEVTAAGFKKVDEKDFLRESYLMRFQRADADPPNPPVEGK